MWYGAADCVCLSSDSEGCPNVLLEALACGTPVVSRKVGGAAEIIRTHTLGILVETDRPRAFANAVELSFSKDWDRGEIAIQGAQRNWKTVGEEVAQILHGVVNSFS